MPEIGLDRSKTGRAKGTPNKTTALLKDAILTAATAVGSDGGGRDGLVGYLQWQAQANPGPFMALLGKVLPMQVDANVDGKLTVQIIRMADADDPAAG